MGSDLRSILFDTQYSLFIKTSCVTWNELNSENINILSILKIVLEPLEGPVYWDNYMSGLKNRSVSCYRCKSSWVVKYGFFLLKKPHSFRAFWILFKLIIPKQAVMKQKNNVYGHFNHNQTFKTSLIIFDFSDANKTFG